MDYKDFKNGQKVMVYIPLKKWFYNANIIETVNGDFTISFPKPIDGHYDQIKNLKNQEELDKWFYIVKRQKITEGLIKEGEDKFKINGKEWLFPNKAFSMQRLAI